jgi:elongation factor G
MERRPILSRSIGPEIESDRQSLQLALSEIAQQDPTVRIKASPTDGHTILSGMDELHLESICDRIVHQYGIPIDVSPSRVIYLETVRKQVAAEGKYIRQTGGSGNYAHVRICVEPNEAGKGFEFINEIKGGVIPQEYIQPVEMGIREAMQGGVLAGHELVDLKVTLFDGSFHEVDSNPMAFQIAAAMAFKEAARKAVPVVLEPVMAIKVTAPEEFMGTIMGELNSCRGRIERITNHRGLASLRAMVPLSQILRSSMKRWPVDSVDFARYEQAPPREETGGEEAGITAIKPHRPAGRSGSIALNPCAESSES